MTNQEQLIEQGIRLQKLINALNTNGKKFAKSISSVQSQVSQFCSGKRRMTMDFLNKITLRYPDVNVSWLLYGEGSIFKEGQSGENEKTVAFSKDTSLAIISSNISTIRRRWGIDQDTFGLMVGDGISRNQVSNWERSRTSVPFDVLIRLEMLTGIPIQKIRTQELLRTEIPAAPLGSAIPESPVAPRYMVNMEDIMRIQEQILQRVINIEELLREREKGEDVAKD